MPNQVREILRLKITFIFKTKADLLKIILFRWLLVASNYHNFDESKIVLQHMLNTISILENMEGRTLCIAYAYVSVSQYYHLLMEYNEVCHVFLF